MRERHAERGRPALVTWLLLAFLLHGVVALLLVPLWPHLQGKDPKLRNLPITLMIVQPDEPEEPVIEPPPTPMGQIVDIAPPKEQERPDVADYLAEFDRTVEKETRTDEFRINPDVLSEKFSSDSRLEFEEHIDLNVPDPSTGAQVGNNRFEPDRNGTMASLPSPFTLTNKDGLQRPAAASHADQALAGSPSNDRLREELGDRVALNTMAVPYANYVNRISRMVSFYVDQNLNNLPRTTPITKPQYDIVAFVVLDGEGVLESIEIRHSSGVIALDRCVIDAFHVAGPFPNPPAQLIAPDGKVYLPTFGYEINFGRGGGVRGPDPNAGVQYPGMLKTNR
jgi:hypothetical protein